MTSPFKVSIILLTIDRFELTKQCVGFALENAGWPNFELLVADNGSKDQRVIEYIESLKPAHFRRNAENLGVGFMHNYLMSKATGDFICIIDNDLMLPIGWLKKLVESYEEKDGILGFHCVDGPNPQYVYGLKFFRWDRMNEIGMFNPKYGLYGLEDSDYNRRMIAAGYTNRYIGESLHLGVGIHDTGEYRKMKDEDLRKAWVMDTKIPRIIHQIWIGPHPKPDKLMQTWKDKHKDWDFYEWNNETIKTKKFRNQHHIDSMIAGKRWCGAADLIRYEVLYNYGGFVAPADSICMRSIEPLLANDSFACYENELMRPGLVSPHLGACPQNKFIGILIDELNNIPTVMNADPWKTTGNLFLTYMLVKHNYTDLKIYPSWFFLPMHYTKISCLPKDKNNEVYARHLWGTTLEKNKDLDKEYA